VTVYYAAIKWNVNDGPNRHDVTNDLEILAMNLVAEHGWRAEQVESALEGAIGAAWEQADELARDT
jgi:hypothetical protein